MTTAQKLKIAGQLEVLLQIAIDRNWTTGSRLELMESIATLRSSRTVVLEFYEHKEGDELPDTFIEVDGLVAHLPDLGEIETEKGGGE